MAMGRTNPYATGNRRYQGGLRAPNVGAVRDKSGYNERDIRMKAQQRALSERLQSAKKRTI